MIGEIHAGRPRRSALLRGTALGAALALLGAAAPAWAQGFTGTVTGTTGSLTIAPDNSDITVFSSEATINWRATGALGDTDVNFLPAANTVTFHDFAGSSSGDFTVLNRVFPQYLDGTGAFVDLNATISLSGTVNSNANLTSGGNIWFYSPHGIITNGSAAFNVGSLLLTTSDIDTSNSSLYLSQATGKTIGFLAASDPNATVRIGATSTITATGFAGTPVSAYVGIFAPRIEQGGAILADGMVGLAAGEAGTMTFNTGLVDIQITQGTDEALGNGIVHSGTTGGGAALAGEVRQIRMVAIPKTTALTMLLGGSIGFDAAAATPDGSAVILSAGIQPTSVQADIAQGLGNLQIGNALIGNASTISATGKLDVLPQFSGAGTGLVRFTGDAQLYVGKALNLVAAAGEQIDATGALRVDPLIALAGEKVDITLTGDTQIAPQHGRLTVGGLFQINASGQPDSAAGLPDTGGNATGGDITISVSQGTLSAGGALVLIDGAVGESANFVGGNAIGGTTDIQVSSKGTITATNLSVDAAGFGGAAFSDGSLGGTGTGGKIILQDNGGTLGFTQVSLFADGFGASGLAAGGDGLGGRVAVTIAGGAQTWDSLVADASAFNANPQGGGTIAGNAVGNLTGVNLTVTGGGQLTVNDLTLAANAYIGAGGDVATSATAGGVDLLVDGGGTLDVNRLAKLTATADIAPNGGLGGITIGPAMSGGRVAAQVDGAGSALRVNQFVGEADAWQIAAFGTAAPILAGQIDVGATNSGLIQLVGGQPLFTVQAVGHGGLAPVAATVEGGHARLYVNGGAIDAGANALAVSAAAIGDVSPFDGFNVGYNAIGGTATVELMAGGPGAGSITAGTLSINAKGEATSLVGANPFADFTGPLDQTTVQGLGADGGSGTGKVAQLIVAAGTLNVGTISIHANGLGGAAGFNFSGGAYQAGNGVGGSALVNQTGGAVNAGTLYLLSEGRGGSYTDVNQTGVVLPLAGNGTAGIAQLALAGGTMALTGGLSIVTQALGGVGSDTGDVTATPTAGGAGDAGGGLAELLMPAGSTGTLTAANALVAARGLGGTGGTNSASGAQADGGAAQGGTARYSLADGAFAVSGAMDALARATGGAGAIGGAATGGTAAFILADTLASPATQRRAGAVTLSASPAGGVGTTSNGAATPGTTKFTAQAGNAASALVIAGNLGADANGLVLAGDGFTGNLGAVPVQVGGDFSVVTTRDINMSVAGGGGIIAAGQIALTGQAITTTSTGTGTGVLSAGGNATVLAVRSIGLGGLSAGGATLLAALDPVSGLFGPVSVASLTSAGPVTVSGSTVLIGSPGSLTFASASASAGDLTVNTLGNLTMGGTSAQGVLTLTSGGALRLAGAASGAAIALKAGGNIQTDAAITTLGTFSALAGGSYAGALALNVPGATSIDAAGGITLPSLTSGGTTLLRATSGAIALVLTSTGAVTLLGRSAFVTSPGALNFASAVATGGDLTINTAGALGIGTASASGALDLTSGGLVTIGGAAEGASITVRSPDLAIGATGRLGRRGLTSAILLINTAPGRGTFIGGPAQQGAWTIDGSEAARLFADQLVTITPAATAAFGANAVTIGALSLTYGTSAAANLGAGGQLVVQTPGAIRVTGPVALNTATNADGLRLTGSTIDFVTDTGSIALTGGGGALVGTLLLDAASVRVGTAAALGDLAGITGADAASTRLDANDGVLNSAGAVRAGSLVVSVTNRFFVQNSGAGTGFDQRRGFAANSLVITTRSPQAQIAINGVLLSARGAMLTGGLTQRGTIINGAPAAAGGAFDALSTINGCVIGRECSTPPGLVVPPFETLAGLIGPLNPGRGLLVLPVIQFGDMPLFDSPPLIDEPVTGVGNDDLWQRR